MRAILPPGAGPRTITSQMLPMLINVAKNRFALIEALAELQNNDKNRAWSICGDKLRSKY